MEPQEIHALLTQKLPGAEVTVEDMTGTRDHFEVIVMWSGFNGKSVIEHHKMVNQALAEPLDEGKIHALKIKTMKTV